MAYLDRQSRVIDVVLTERGRKLYSTGRLDFSYFGLFDDLIDYDPVCASGSFDHDSREQQIEATPIMEAPFIQDTRGMTAPMEPRSHLFTAAPGYVQIPTMIHPINGDTVDLMADQRRDGGVYRRTGTNLAQIDMDVIGDTERGNPGFIVRVLSSGSNGTTDLGFRRDLDARRAVDPFIAVVIDDETPVDVPSPNRPESTRVNERVSPRKR